MSTTTKSPKKVARAAFKIAKSALPPYAHRYSPQKFTQPQLFVCLVLKIFIKTDYRGIVAILNDSPDLCKCFRLKTIPHFTTLQKASRRLLQLNAANKLLYATIDLSTNTFLRLCSGQARRYRSAICPLIFERAATEPVPVVIIEYTAGWLAVKEMMSVLFLANIGFIGVFRDTRFSNNLRVIRCKYPFYIFF